MTQESIPHNLPSQEGMPPSDMVLDCLEKIRVLIQAIPEGDYFLQYAGRLSFHQYVTLIDDLIDIAIYQHQQKESSET